MLVFEVKLHVAACDGLRGGIVVFHVVGAKPHPAIGDVDVVFCQIQIANAFLWATGRDLRDRSGWRMWRSLLSQEGRSARQEQQERQTQAGSAAQHGMEEESKHSANQSMKMKSYSSMRIAGIVAVD